MTCTRKISPKFPEFSEPKWEAFDALAHLDVLEGMLRQLMDASSRFRWENAGGYYDKIRELYPKTPTVYDMKKAGLIPPSVGDIWLKSRKAAIDVEWALQGKKRLERWVARLKKKEWWLERAHFDIDDTGEAETVYRIGSHGCYFSTADGPPPPHNPKMERDDISWGLWVLERDSPNIAFRNDLRGLRNPHIFFYGERTYIDGWQDALEKPPSSSISLIVYSLGNSVHGEFGNVCPIVYAPEDKD